MNCNKTLRDIWSSADQECIDAMQGRKIVSRNTRTTNQIPSFDYWCDAQENKSKNDKNASFSHQHPDQLKLNENFSSQRAYIKIDNNPSLESIWAPTTRDDFLKRNVPINPPPGWRSPKREIPDPKSFTENRINNAKDSSSEAESEVSNNYDSQESQDELNDETFGKFAAVPEEFRPNKADLTNLSVVTQLFDSQLKNSSSTGSSNLKQQSNVDKSNSNISPNTISSKNFPVCNNSSAKYDKGKTRKKRPRNRINLPPHAKSATRGRDRHTKFTTHHSSIKKETFASGPRGKNSTETFHEKTSEHTVDYEVLKSKKERDIHVSQVKRDPPNAPRHYQVPSKPIFKETLEIETREIVESIGNSQRFTTQKVTYIQGKKVSKVIEVQNIQKGKMKWDSRICLPTNEKEARKAQCDNLNKLTLTNERKDTIQWKNSENQTSSLSRTENSSFQNGNSFEHHYYGAKPKNSNSYNYYNVPKTDAAKKDLHMKCKEYVSEEVNIGTKRFNAQFKTGLFDELNRNELQSNNITNKDNNTQEEKNGFKKVSKTQCFENRVSWHIIGSETNEEQGTSKLRSSNEGSDDKDKIKNGSCLHKKCEFEITNDKYLLSGVRDISLKTPKILNVQNTLTGYSNHKTDKLRSLRNNQFSPSHELKQHGECKVSKLIKYAKDIADLIVGSERALNMFKSFYGEWSVNRTRSIKILEQIVETINKSSKRGQTISSILAAINIAVALGETVIPNKAVSIGAKIAAGLVGYFATLANKGVDKNDLKAREFEIKELFQQDIDASSSVYIYGMQCSSQFQDTCSVIKEFHLSINSENFAAVAEDDNVKEFLSEISEYNPANFTVFYKRLRLGYEKLMSSSVSRENKAFCRVFEDVPEAIDVINLLSWQFCTDGFDHTCVEHYWNRLFDSLYDSQSKNVEEFLRNVQECLFILKKERCLLERSVVNLFKKEDLKKLET